MRFYQGDRDFVYAVGPFGHLGPLGPLRPWGLTRLPVRTHIGCARGVEGYARPGMFTAISTSFFLLLPSFFHLDIKRYSVEKLRLRTSLTVTVLALRCST